MQNRGSEEQESRFLECIKDTRRRRRAETLENEPRGNRIPVKRGVRLNDRGELAGDEDRDVLCGRGRKYTPGYRESSAPLACSLFSLPGDLSNSSIDYFLLPIDRERTDIPENFITYRELIDGSR